ncbi:MAG: hypothetical protein K6T81_16665 [Alicyclobacillus macrosporangiidus]|uniref:hypothetical protein n=1 Tax=Alicyclobacillus macrosporangiidus TaxID=392015 RepID=UPI0026EF8034|nr:hypothetical protein [Alicyclobacillus macrosporangiidus]MCL6600345.1 hypothetical protein [Alicyclobacillus macrosporangiidus]
MARNPEKKRCKARNRQGEPCKNWAKPGYDVCHYHGAGGGAPPGNKNAVTTGEYETIWLDALNADERVLFHVIDTDALAQLDNEIRLTEIRERRMLKRIADLRQVEFTVTEVRTEVGEGPMGPIDKRDERAEATLGQIQRIEEALTRVQERKAKLIELKHKILNGGRDDTKSLERLVQAIRESGGA